MINIKNLSGDSISLSELKDKNGRFRYDESSEQFGMSVSVQYEKLINDIKEHGQEKPIYIWRGLICDGRNRCKALDELGTKDVDVINLPHKCRLEERIDLAQRIELTHRHNTPTQFACIAVKEYFRLKKAKKKVTKDSILEIYPATATNFTYAKSLYEKYPLIFKRLFHGELVKTDDTHAPTQSLAAVANFYKKEEKAADEAAKQRKEDEEFERFQPELTDEERINAIAYYKKQDSFKNIAVLITNSLEAQGLDHAEFLKYLNEQVVEDNL